jgi:hypothetical protein
MKNLIYILIFCGALISCNRPYIQKPDDLLSKSEMVDVLVELYKSQQMLNNITSQSGNQVLDIAQNTLYIFEEQGITYQQFEGSYKYYFTNPTEYQKILDDVKDELTDQLSEEERKRLEQLKAESPQQ